jgi:ADP-heptose:LPS heptosyltransferase
MAEQVHISCGMAPGDCVALTGAVRDLKLSHPDLEIVVHAPFPNLWENNPRITYSKEKNPTASIQPRFPFKENLVEEHRIELESRFGYKITRGPNVGEVFGPFDWKPPVGRYVAMMAGGKQDTPTKWWPWWKELAAEIHKHIVAVHFGAIEHWHEVIQNTYDVVGKTTLREFASGLYHAAGLVSPVTCAVHLIRAVGNSAPMVTIGGGREEPWIVEYPNQSYLSSIGTLPCCQKACWEFRCPHMVSGYAKCMENISPREVADLLLKGLSC